MELKNCKGIILIAVYLLIAVLVILGAAFFMQSYNEINLARRHKFSTEALAIAEAGIERAIYDLKQEFKPEKDKDWSNGVEIDGVTFGPDPDPDDPDGFYTIHLDIALADGFYTVKLRNITGETDRIWIRSTGTVSGVSRTIQTYVKMDNINIWNNAIFGGVGAEGGVINGNVDIRGSVHLLGEGLEPDDFAMSMSGAAKIGNNYEDIPDSFKDRIPELEGVETLEATLRVKYGQAGLSGSATVGEEDVPDNDYKETIDGVYVTDGFGGSQGAANVYSDNGTENKYDLGNKITFPSLSDPYGGYPTYMDYLRDNALVISGLDINPGSNFSYTDGTNSISMGEGNLSINGIVYIDGGDLNFDKKGGDKKITYTGTGTIAVDGNVSIKTNLLTQGDNSFPDNIIGIMTPNNITFNASQIDVMGLFYGEDTIASQKQTDVAGAFVSNFFDMGTNVPSIYQVPEVINYMPPGMIGTNSVWIIKVVAWQEQ